MEKTITWNKVIHLSFWILTLTLSTPSHLEISTNIIKKYKKKEETLTKKKKVMSRWKTPINTWKFHWYVWTITDVFLNQKRANVCEQMVKMVPHGIVFTVCSHTFTLFWLRKTSVLIETFQLGFLVFMCTFHQAIFSFFQ